MIHRCGRHAVPADPASQMPVWLECAVHRSCEELVDRWFDTMVGLEFGVEEILRLGRIARHGMLD